MGAIHIACNIDDVYTQHCGTMLTSLFVNNRDENFHVHVIAKALSDENIGKLRQIAGNYGNELSFYLGNEQLIDKCQVMKSSYISISTYYRCFIDTILPRDIDRIIYLDSDMVVTSSVRELWDTDLEGNAIGAVEDMWAERDDNFERLGYEKSYSYVNAGVLLVDLDYLRKFDFTTKVADYLAHNAEKLTFYDQDIINALLYDKKKMLSFKWNLQHRFLYKTREIRQEVWPELDKVLTKPSIVHYTGDKKPWLFGSEHPYTNLYFHYLAMTPWKEYKPTASFSVKSKKAFYKILYPLGLKKRKYKRMEMPAHLATNQ